MYDLMLVPLDGSRMAEVALDHAVEIARRFRSRIILLRAVSPLEVLAGPGFSAPGMEGEEVPVEIPVSGAEVGSAREYLSNLESNLSSEGITASVRVIEGEPVDVILDEAQAAGASLIVMSTHGRGGLKRVGPGSVASSILAHSKVPVHVVPYR